MNGAFGYLILSEARNRLRRQAARLRSPRYALALLAGLAYFWLVFGGRGVWAHDAAPGPGATLVGPLRAAGSLMLGLYAAMTWINGKADALAYRPAEVHLLFTAPLSRRDLLRYKLLHAQVPLAFSAVFMTLISHDAPLPWWLRLPSIWVLFATLQLHHLAAALVHASAQQQGFAGWRRNWLPITVFTAAALAVLISIAGVWPQVRTAGSIEHAAALLKATLATGAAGIALAPFRLVLAPVVANPEVWPRAFGIAVLVLLAHYVWVLRSDTAFEEAAAEAGERKAKATQALRTGGGWRSYSRALRPERESSSASRPAAFTLPLHGLPEVALLWKNLTFARRNFSLASPVMLSIGMVALVMMFRSGGGSTADALLKVGTMAFGFGAMTVVVGPVWIRNDLRMDLRHIELLRTMPLPPAKLVGAEIAASAITLSLLQLVLFGVSALLVTLSGNPPLPPVQFALACIGALLVVPALATLGVTIQCAIAVTFPGWVHLGSERPGGVEAMGQNLLTLAGALILLVLLLVPPALVGLLVFGATGLQWGPLAPYMGGLAGIAAVYGEVVFAAQALGRLFARTDPSDVGLAS